MQGLDLFPQILRHGRSIGFVLRIYIISKGLALGIEYHTNEIGLFIIDKLAQHVQHDIDDMRRAAIRTRQVYTARVVGAKQVGAAVNQHQFFLFLLIHTVALK